jgi:hypothetical protein
MNSNPEVIEAHVIMEETEDEVIEMQDMGATKSVTWSESERSKNTGTASLFISCETKAFLPRRCQLQARPTGHSGGNDRFCARLKTDISASNSGLRGRTRSCLTFLERGRRDESKVVRHDLR